MNQNEAMESLRGLQGLWDGFILNPRFKRIHNTITWETDDRRHLPDRILRADFEQLAKDRQFSFQLFDGSIVQIYYRFSPNGTALDEAHLAFVQQPTLEPTETKTRERIEVDGTKVLVDEVLRLEFPASWLRIDYEPHLWGGCLHSNCHMHSSLSADIRLPFRGVPCPAQFIDAIASWFYPALFRRHHLNESHRFKDRIRLREICSQRLETGIDDECTHLIHLTLPFTSGEEKLLPSPKG
ncbi:MAG: DUF2290 domain-containing protein [Phycisphaerae bacterium]